MAPSRICVFAGASSGPSEYQAVARALGAELARRRLGLVYGGAAGGLMGAVADSVLAAGGDALGVVPAGVWPDGLNHRGLAELEIVENMHERKARMARLARAFVALPGGLGTFEELFEVLAWSRLGLHAKPVGILDVKGYFTPFLALLERAAADGLIADQAAALVAVDQNPSTLLDRLLARCAEVEEPAPGPERLDRVVGAARTDRTA
jgi:uncharacterized protein (TIGR00730 family)